MNYTHIFSPNVVNNFIGSVLWYSAIFGNLAPGPSLALFPGNLAFPVDGALTALGTGSGNPGGFAQGFLYPQGRRVTQWQLVDDLSVARGNHNFKMGVNFRRDDITDLTAASQTLYPAINATLFGFANDQVAPTGCNLSGGTQLGCGSVQYNFASSPEQPVAYYSVGFYFQDEFRATSRLKLTMTLAQIATRAAFASPVVRACQFRRFRTCRTEAIFRTTRQTAEPSRLVITPFFPASKRLSSSLALADRLDAIRPEHRHSRRSWSVHRSLPRHDPQRH